jgi:hypothetical protein
MDEYVVVVKPDVLVEDEGLGFVPSRSSTKEAPAL